MTPASDKTLASSTLGQLSRYTIVGLISNLVIYIGYLLLTWTGMGHKSAMTLLYILGMLQTFYFNKSWSFQFRGSASFALQRYVFVYIGGYIINYLSLWVMVDKMAYPHQLIQGIMIIIVAGMIFLLQKHWIFSSPRLKKSITHLP